MSRTPLVTKDHADYWNLVGHLRLCQCQGNAELDGQGCHLEPWRCPGMETASGHFWVCGPVKAISGVVSMTLVANEGSVDAQSLASHLGPWRSMRAMMPSGLC